MANVLGQAVGAPLWGLAYDLTGGYEIAMFIAAFIVAVSYLIVMVSAKTATKNASEETKPVAFDGDIEPEFN